MAKSAEYRALVICADEFKILLKQQKSYALEDELNQFLGPSDDNTMKNGGHSELETGSPFLVDSMIELVKEDPRKYHEFISNLKAKINELENLGGKKDTVAACNMDIATLEALYKILSQSYCELQMRNACI